MSFNKAADRLHYAQPSISVQIHALEEELGVEFIDRLGKKMRLTETGERLLGYAKKIMDLTGGTVLLSKVDCSCRRSFEQLLDHKEVRGVSKFEFYSIETLKRCVITGVGVAVLPESAVVDEAVV